MTIKCKAVYIEKVFIISFISALLLILITCYFYPPMWSNFSLTFSWLISICIFSGFYKNRFELLEIGIGKTDLKLKFVNNTIFKRKEINIPKEAVKAKLEADKLVFSIEGHKPAIVRKRAVQPADWEALLQAFTRQTQDTVAQGA